MDIPSSQSVTIRFAMPSEELAPFVTTYYRTDVQPAFGAEYVEDQLHPEWGNVRFSSPEFSKAAVGNGAVRECPEFLVAGPTSVSSKIRMARGRGWGIGLLPLGWLRFIGSNADKYADDFFDGYSSDDFDAFQPLARKLAASDGTFEEELQVIEDHMAQLDYSLPENTDTITRVHLALVDPEISSVSDLADVTGLNVRSLERLTKQSFGFSPKLLLRRKRFLRSLSAFMLDPSFNWLNALDYQYHDHAQFVKEFKGFMGMTPTAYAKLEKPLINAAMKGRMEILGRAVQGLHEPTKPKG